MPQNIFRLLRGRIGYLRKCSERRHIDEIPVLPNTPTSTRNGFPSAAVCAAFRIFFGSPGLDAKSFVEPDGIYPNSGRFFRGDRHQPRYHLVERTVPAAAHDQFLRFRTCRLILRILRALRNINRRSIARLYKTILKFQEDDFESVLCRISGLMIKHFFHNRPFSCSPHSTVFHINIFVYREVRWGSDSDPAAPPGAPSKLFYPDSRMPVSGGFCVRTYAIQHGKNVDCIRQLLGFLDIRLRDPRVLFAASAALFFRQIDIFVEGRQQSPLLLRFADRHRILPLNRADRFFLDPARLFRRLDRILLLLSRRCARQRDSNGHFSQSGRPPGCRQARPAQSMPDYIHLDEITLLTVMPWKPHRHHHRLTNRNLSLRPAHKFRLQAPLIFLSKRRLRAVLWVSKQASEHAPHFHPAPEPADHTRSTQLPLAV